MRLLTSLFAALCLLLPLAASAQSTCNGRDLITDMASADRAALDAAVAAAPFNSGNHWRAEKGKQQIDIIGTFHMYDPRMQDVVARLDPLIQSADAIYLEATDTEIADLQAEIAKRPELMFSAGATLPERLNAREWQTLSQALAARGIPAFMASKFQPWYVSVLLAVPPCAMGAMGGGSNGLDHLIGQAATANQKPLLALEPYDTVLKIFDQISPDDQLDMIRAALPTAGQAEDMMATMVESYFRQEHRQIWEYNRMAAIAAAADNPAKAAADLALMEETMINARNRAWVARLDADTHGTHLLVAAGAGHLAGEQGLLNLLAQDGWTLTRQEF